MWPSSPAAPVAPRTSSPSTTIAPPIPVPSVSITACAGAARRPEAVLGEHRRVGVVVDDDRQAEALGHQVAERHVLDRQVVGEDRDAALRGRSARGCRTRRLATSPLGGGADLLHRRRRSCRAPRGSPSPRARRKARWWTPRSRVDGTGEQLRAAEVDADHAAAGHRPPPYTARAGPPRAPPVHEVPRHAAAVPPCASAAARAGGPCRRRAAAPRLRAAAGPRRGCACRAGASLRWLVLALVGWIALSVVLFLISAQLRQGELDDTGLGGGGFPLTVADDGPRARLRHAHRRLPRSRARRRAAAGARTRSCSCASAAARTRGSRSRATRSSTSPATAARRSTPRTPSAAPPLAVADGRGVPRHRGQPRRRGRLRELPRADRRDGRHQLHRAAASSRASTAASSNGGYTLRLRRGHDPHRRQAGARAGPHAQERLQPARGRPHAARAASRSSSRR